MKRFVLKATLEVALAKAGETLAKQIERKVMHYWGLTRLGEDLYLYLQGGKGKEWRVGFIWRF